MKDYFLKIRQPKIWPNKIWYLSHKFAKTGYRHQIRPYWEIKPIYLTNSEIYSNLGLFFLIKTLYYEVIYWKLKNLYRGIYDT